MLRLRWPGRWLAAALLCLAPALLPTRAGAVTVTVQPPDTTVTVGDTFSLRIQIDAVSDLKGYELIYGYGGVLSYLGPLAGDILFADANPYLVQPLADVAAPADSAATDVAKLVSSAHGPGVMLYLRFKALSQGVSPINCLLVDLRDSFNNVTLPPCVGGVVHVEGPVPTRRTNWARVKQIYR
jgi:hypothetical protein